MELDKCQRCGMYYDSTESIVEFHCDDCYREEKEEYENSWPKGD